MSQSVPLDTLRRTNSIPQIEVRFAFREFSMPSATKLIISLVQIKTMPGLDANVYATKKTIAQGMLDVALLTANASQLKYLLQLGRDQQFYYLVSLSNLLINCQLQRFCLVVDGHIDQPFDCSPGQLLFFFSYLILAFDT